MPSYSILDLSLQGLPSEVQQQILSHLVSSKSFNSIHSLLLTCKHLYDIALPFSVQTYSNAPLLSRSDGPQPRNRTLQFLRYITLIKPEVARHVQTLDLQEWSYERNPSSKALRVKPDERLLYQKLLRKELPSEKKSNLNYISRWSKALNEGVEDASLALLLVVCSNIQTLLFAEAEQESFFTGFLSTVISDALAAGGSTDNFLNRLHCVKHHGGGSWELSSLEFEKFHLWLFQMPGIKTFEVDSVCVHKVYCETIDKIPRRSSSIESLPLSDSTSMTPAFHSLIGACRSLRLFHYKHESMGCPEEVTPRDIISALLLHADTLEDLHVTSSCGLDYWHKLASSQDPGWTYMGSQLSQMHKLKHLALAVEALTGIHNRAADYPPDVFRKPAPPPLAECIPEQLEYLEIEHPKMEDMAYLVEFVETLRSGNRFSQLRLVRFRFGSSRVEKEELQSLHVNKDGLTVGGL
ncbi:hypothetical protein F53441_6378 [Fusarium austroafricanum]|uniref:F-box domain-containing protein n=1 Tax=Fusarium austroafricanum TaxID=2364996 RepID=A0A8H4KJT3_9HYPO|nr:hypothetical protein F53441_6378 [Fusarium austroafricanum]